MVCYHQGRYGVETMIESLLRDRTVSWVRIVNGTSEEIPTMNHENSAKVVLKCQIFDQITAT